jgi:hypothetical protein
MSETKKNGISITTQLAKLNGSIKISEKISERVQNKNLKPFPKGVSGHPEGHPKGKPNYNTLREKAIIDLGKETGMTPAEVDKEIIKSAIKEAMGGNFQFYRDDKDRVFGQSVSRSEIGGLEDGSPLKLELSIQKLLDKTYGDENNDSN